MIQSYHCCFITYLVSISNVSRQRFLSRCKCTHFGPPLGVVRNRKFDWKYRSTTHDYDIIMQFRTYFKMTTDCNYNLVRLLFEIRVFNALTAERITTNQSIDLPEYVVWWLGLLSLVLTSYKRMGETLLDSVPGLSPRPYSPWHSPMKLRVTTSDLEWYK